MIYQDFTLRARDRRNETFKVEVTGSPVDRMRDPEEVRLDREGLAQALRDLEHKRLRRAELVALGRALADALLPPTVRGMLERSLDALGPDQGLRVRMVLDDPGVADLPWEYLYLAPAGGEPGLTGFLALDPRISLVRHEAIPSRPNSVVAQRPLKLVVAFASPRDAAPLDLDAERGYIEAALAGVEGVEVTYVDHLTVERLEEACRGAHILHYAGHGVFAAGGAGAGVGSREIDLAALPPGAEAGHGALALEDEHGRARLFPAERLALTLRGAGVRLVVMGACETGRRDGINVWSGVTPALMRADIPGALGMQYAVRDDSAVAFARGFYRSVAAGLTLDEAVVAGRLSMVNAGGDDDAEWGVPVLYLRSSDGVIFPEVSADRELEPERKSLRFEIAQHVETLRGRLVGAQVDTLRRGELDIDQAVGTVAGGAEVTGLAARRATGGEAHIAQEVETVEEEGSVVGLSLDDLG